MNKHRKYLAILKVIPKLGYRNVAYIIWYRITLKTGIRKLFFNVGNNYEIEDFFYDNNKKTTSSKNLENLKQEYNDLKQGTFTYFFFHKYNINNPPNWFFDPFNNYQYQHTKKHWCDVNEFSGYDIKIIWEPSRFQWLMILARYFRESGDIEAFKLANEWTQNWINQNPLNIGPQWKCGQECSLRILHFVLALRIFSKENLENPKDTIAKFVYEHAIRINKNLLYACAQDNNHGTSEALALFIAGCFLENSTLREHKKVSKKLKKRGRKVLEKLLSKLVLKDGSFSQRSVNYHRVLLDTLSMAEFFRREFKEPKFNLDFYQRGKAAINWMHNFIANDETGETPNFGNNDGAKLLCLTSAPYHDYRESVNICSYFLNNYFLYDINYNIEILNVLELNKAPVKKIKKKSIHLKNGGYLIFRKKTIFCFLHAPIFKFRPSQNDLLHIDLWKNGKNLLIDSGTYSYNLELDLANNKYHNTFNIKELSLNKIGKFLYSDWLNVFVESFNEDKAHIKVKKGKFDFFYTLTINENSILIDLEKYYCNKKIETEFVFNAISYDSRVLISNKKITTYKSQTSDHYLKLVDSHRKEVITENGRIKIKF